MRQSIINKLNSNSMSKKVIEQIKVVKYFGKGEKEPTVIDNPSARELTTVAKAICPEYQKVIDQNAKLVEALEGLVNSNPIHEGYHEKKLKAIEALQNTKNIEG